MNELTWSTIIIAAVSGLAASLASPVVNHFIQNRRDTHNRKQRILDEVANKVAEVVTKGYDYILNEPSITEPHFYKSANRLDGMGKTKLADSIREFMDLWKYLHNKNDTVKMKRADELAKFITTTRI